MIVICEDGRTQRVRVADARSAALTHGIEVAGILDGAFVTEKAVGYAFDTKEFDNGEFVLVGQVTEVKTCGEYHVITCDSERDYLIASHESQTALDAFLACKAYRS